MSNFEHATEATTTALNSQGSAMEENAAYMESLEARTNAIKKDFQDLANHVINSQLVKSILSLTHELLQLADTGLGRVLIQLTLLGGIGWGAGHLIHASNILQVFKSDLVGFGKLLITLTGQQELLAVATGASAAASEADAAAKAKEAAAAKEASIALGQALIVLGFFVGTAAAIYGLIKLFDHLNVTFEEQKSKLEDLNEQYKELTGEGSELEQLKSKIGNLTEAEKNRLAVLLAEEESLKRQIAQQAQLTYNSYTQEHTEDRYISEGDRAYWKTIDLNAEAATKAKVAFADLSRAYEGGRISASEFKEGLYEQIHALENDAQYLKTVQESGVQLTDGQLALISVYDLLTNQLTETTEATGEFDNIITDQEQSIQSLVEQLNELNDAFSTLRGAYSDFNKDGKLSYSTIASISEKFGELGEETLNGYINKLTDANLTSGELNSILSDMTIALAKQRIETMGLTTDDQRLVEMMLEEAGVANAAEIAAYLLRDAEVAVSNATDDATGAIQDFNNQPVDVSNKKAQVASLGTEFDGLQQKIIKTHKQFNAFMGSVSGWSKKTQSNGYVSVADLNKEFRDNQNSPVVVFTEEESGAGGGGGGGGGGGSRSTAEKEKTQLEILKEKLKAIEDSYSDILSLTDSQYQLLVNQKAPTEDIVAKAQEYLNYLHQENEDLRALLDTIEDNEENHALILDIQTKINKNSSTWFTWSKKINDIYSDIANNSAKIVDDLNDKWKKSVDEQADALKALQGQMVDYYDERIEDIDKQIDGLNNNNKALKEQITLEEKLDAISRARQSRIMVYKDGKWQYVEDIDAVSSAVKDFQDYIRERQLQEQIEGLEKEKSALEDIKNAWNNMTKEFDDAKDKWLISQKLMIDTTLEEWQRLIDGVENYTAQYASIMSGESPYSTGRTSSNAYTTTTSKGGTVTYSSENAIDFIENKPIGSYMEGGDGSLWYKREDGSTVVTAQDGAVAVVNAKYANGTLGASGGLSLVGEHGTELRVLNRGDGILPADITRNLMAWGQTTPMQYIGNKFGQAMNVTIQALNLPNVVDGQGFVDYVRNNMFGQVLSYVH